MSLFNVKNFKEDIHQNKPLGTRVPTWGVFGINIHNVKPIASKWWYIILMHYVFRMWIIVLHLQIRTSHESFLILKKLVKQGQWHT